MKRFLFVFACLLSFVLPQAASADTANLKSYVQEMLNLMVNVDLPSTRPNPDDPEGAKAIITNTLSLIGLADAERLKPYNESFAKLGIEDMFIVPHALLEARICDFYGFTLGKYKNLKEASYSQLGRNGFYVVALEQDPSPPGFKVEAVTMLKNGLARADGLLYDEGETMPFVAYFKKSACGGREHWVFYAINYPAVFERDTVWLPQE